MSIPINLTPWWRINQSFINNFDINSNNDDKRWLMMLVETIPQTFVWGLWLSLYYVVKYKVMIVIDRFSILLKIIPTAADSSLEGEALRYDC